VETHELKKAGLKVTLPRIKILEVLEQNADQHLSAEDIYRILLEQGEEIGLATVYRVLTQFEDAEIVTRHQFEGGKAVFELVAKGNHDHIVCVKTGVVEEFYDPIIQERINKIAEEHGFEITDHALVIYGIKRNNASA
jgi:Fur family ferric uptake transcriptional regulator